MHALDKGAKPCKLASAQPPPCRPCIEQHRMPSCTVRGAAAALFATVSLMVVPGDAASAYGSGATTSRSVYELTAAAKRRALQGIALTLCPPQLTFNGPLWANATGLPEDMYLVGRSV